MVAFCQLSPGAPIKDDTFPTYELAAAEALKTGGKVQGLATYIADRSRFAVIKR
jgi:hypothetical protein